MANKIEEARRSGMAYAYKICQDNGYDVPELKKELEFRNITKAPLMVPRSEVERFQNELKMNCVYTFKLATLITLRDAFDFGPRRMQRFWDRFMDKIDSLLTCDPSGHEYATWKDYADIIEEECGIVINVPDSFKE